MIYDTNLIALAVHAPVGIEVPKRSAAAGVCEAEPRSPHFAGKAELIWADVRCHQTGLAGKKTPFSSMIFPAVDSVDFHRNFGGSQLATFDY